MTTRYKGYAIDTDWQEPLSTCTITAPSGKLVHTFQYSKKAKGAHWHYAADGMKWIDGLADREADPRKAAIDATMECLKFAKALEPDTLREMDCPLCDGGKIRCIKSSYNGHTQGRCSTKECIGWIE